MVGLSLKFMVWGDPPSHVITLGGKTLKPICASNTGSDVVKI